LAQLNTWDWNSFGQLTDRITAHGARREGRGGPLPGNQIRGEDVAVSGWWPGGDPHGNRAGAVSVEPCICVNRLRTASIPPSAKRKTVMAVTEALAGRWQTLTVGSRKRETIMIAKRTTLLSALILVCAAAMAATWSHGSLLTTRVVAPTGIDPFGIQSQMDVRTMPEETFAKF